MAFFKKLEITKIHMEGQIALSFKEKLTQNNKVETYYYIKNRLKTMLTQILSFVNKSVQSPEIQPHIYK